MPALPRSSASVSKRCLSTSSIASRPAPLSPSPASAAKAGGPSDPAAHIHALVSSRDHSNYLAHYFYPRPLQLHFLTLRAFNAELASLKESVSSEILGRMRMGWWRDAVRGAFRGKPPKHPVALAIRDAIHDPLVRGALVEDHFLRVIQAREDDLSEPLTPPTLDTLETYAEATSSRLLYLSLNLLNLSDPALDELFSHIGKASGLALSLRALPFHANPPRSGTAGGARRLSLPREYVAAHGVVEEEVFRKGPEAKGLRDAVFDTATRANDYLITARTLIKNEFGGKVPDAAVGPMLAAVPARSYIERLESADFDPFAPQLQQARHWRLPWDMWRASRKRVF